MPLTMLELNNELNADPQALGYGPFLANGNDQALADILNFPRNGTAASPENGVVGAAITVRRADIESQEVIQAILVSDYTALPANPSAIQLSTERRYLAWMSGLAAVPSVRLLNDDGTEGPVIANFNAMFPAASGTRQRLNALASRTGSRSEQLFGPGVSVSAADVARALRET